MPISRLNKSRKIEFSRKDITQFPQGQHARVIYQTTYKARPIIVKYAIFNEIFYA